MIRERAGEGRKRAIASGVKFGRKILLAVAIIVLGAILVAAAAVLVAAAAHYVARLGRRWRNRR